MHQTQGGLVITGHAASTFVTRNKRPPCDHLRPGHGNQSHAINSPHGDVFDL